MVCSYFVILWSDTYVVIVLSDEPMQNQGRGLTNYKLVKAPPPHTPASNFSDGRPKAALLFWFFCDFRCGALLFMMVILVIYIGKNSCLMLN